MDRDSHIAGDNTPFNLSRITFVVLSLVCAGGGIFVGLLGTWQGFLFAAFWIPMFFIGATGRPKVLFEGVPPNVYISDFESSGFHGYISLDYLLLAAMALTGLAYILLATWWPRLPHFAPDQAMLYLLVATATNAYLWQCNISPRNMFWGCACFPVSGGILLWTMGSAGRLPSAAVIYASAWGMLHSGLLLRRRLTR
jgi:hypothetical protein